MHGNNFLKSAMEQITEGVGVPSVDQNVSVISPDNNYEVDHGAALAAAQAQNSELQQELIETDEQNSDLVADRVTENIDNIEAAVEALQELGHVVSGALRAGTINAHANAGFAMALESICNSVYIRDASSVAALEANAVMHYDGAGDDPKAAEQAKGKGIFSTIREKIKQIWAGLVQMVRRVMANLDNAKFYQYMMREAADLGRNLALVDSLLKSNYRGKVKDEGLIKTIGVSQGDDVSKMMVSSAKVIQATMHYVVDYERMASGALRSVEDAPSETVREGVQNAVWKLSGELAKAITAGAGADDNAKQIESTKLVGGIVLQLNREKREGAIAKIDLSYRVSDINPVAEIDTMSQADLNSLHSTIESIKKFSQGEGNVLSDVKKAVERLKPTVPSAWMNVDNIDDVQRYASAALGYIAKHTVQLNSVVMRVLYMRWILSLTRWAKATAEQGRADAEAA